MGERFELSFKNKEVRMWFYIMIPAIVIGNLILLLGGYIYNNVLWILLVIALVSFYTWRYFYRKKQNK